MSLKGKRALITGAAGAMGSVLIQRFLSEGMAVVGIVRQSPARKHGALPTTYLQADTSIEEDVHRVFAEAEKILGGLDVLVNAVGGFIPGKPIAEVSVADWDAIFRMNLQSVFLCTREALRLMKKRSYGRIINFSAMTAFEPAPGKAPYAIAKAGVSLLTDSVAREVKGTGITVNSIAPGIIATEENKSSMPNENFSKWVTPDEIADTVCMLCRDESGAINGTTLKLFGGL